MSESILSFILKIVRNKSLKTPRVYGNPHAVDWACTVARFVTRQMNHEEGIRKAVIDEVDT
jgi:hypothetical protein